MILNKINNLARQNPAINGRICNPGASGQNADQSHVDGRRGYLRPLRKPYNRVTKGSKRDLSQKMERSCRSTESSALWLGIPHWRQIEEYFRVRSSDWPTSLIQTGPPEPA